MASVLVQALSDTEREIEEAQQVLETKRSVVLHASQLASARRAGSVQPSSPKGDDTDDVLDEPLDEVVTMVVSTRLRAFQARPSARPA